MSGAVGSVAALAKHLVRIEVGHVVSSSSMVSRAYLTDDCVGVVVDAGERGLWLVSSLPALAPAPDGLRERAADKGGIPVEHGTPRLAKVTLRWADASVDLANPTVVGSGGVGVVSLAVPASFGKQVRSGEGPRPVDLSATTAPGLGERVAIPVLSGAGAVVLWSRVASDNGYDGHSDGVALDTAIPAELAGSPAFVLSGPTPSFCGLVQPVDALSSVLRPPNALLAAISAG